MPFRLPTTTPVPDELFDLWIQELSEGELKVLLYIVRRTLGFRKTVDAISFDQFITGIKTRDGRVLDRGCLKNKTSLARALRGLEDKQLIRSQKTTTEAGGYDVTLYSLYFSGDEALVAEPDPRALPAGTRGGTFGVQGGYVSGTRGGTPNVTGVVRQTYPQQTVVQETESQQPPLPPSPKGERAPRQSAAERRIHREEAQQADVGRFSRGRYGVCAECGQSPHDPECALATGGGPA